MKYTVTVPYAVFVSIEVEADSEYEAEEIAVDETGLQGLVGNGGLGDKMIGPVNRDCSIEANDIPIEQEPYGIVVDSAS